MEKTRKYISGHDVRRFFFISMRELQKLSNSEHAKQNCSRYKLYDLDFMEANYKKISDIPEHLIKSEVCS